MAARVQLWQGRHQAAILLFRESLAIRPNRQLQTELERVEALDALAQVDRLLAAGRDDEAETRLSDLYQSGRSLPNRRNSVPNLTQSPGIGQFRIILRAPLTVQN